MDVKLTRNSRFVRKNPKTLRSAKILLECKNMFHANRNVSVHDCT